MYWSLKNLVFGSSKYTKQYRFLVTSGVYFLKKYDELSESVAFGQKLRYFTAVRGILQTRMDERGDHMKMNFEYFQTQK